MSAASNFNVYAGGDLPLQNGGVLRDAQLAYATYGELSQDKDNVVLYAASYAARHEDIDWLVGGRDGARSQPLFRDRPASSRKWALFFAEQYARGHSMQRRFPMSQSSTM